MVEINIWGKYGTDDILQFKIPDEDIGEFLNKNRASSARRYLLNLLDEGYLSDRPDWDKDKLMEAFTVSIPEMNVKYLLSKDRSPLLQLSQSHSHLTKQSQKCFTQPSQLQPISQQSQVKSTKPSSQRSQFTAASSTPESEECLVQQSPAQSMQLNQLDSPLQTQPGYQQDERGNNARAIWPDDQVDFETTGVTEQAVLTQSQPTDQNEQIMSSDSQIPTCSTEAPRIFLWSDNATKNLISVYKERKELFFHRSIKKSQLWKEITKKLIENGFGNPSVVQVEDKFKNLRRNYAKVKDAMGPNSSGAPAPEKFKYFDEMDEIFGKSPSFDPPLIIGSRRAQEVIDLDIEEQPKKMPKNMENLQSQKDDQSSKTSKKQNTIERILNSQEVRHREILKEIQVSRIQFCEKLDKLIEKL